MKNKYIKPSVLTVKLAGDLNIMAGSQTTHADAKGDTNYDLWDDDNYEEDCDDEYDY